MVPCFGGAPKQLEEPDKFRPQWEDSTQRPARAATSSPVTTSRAASSPIFQPLVHYLPLNALPFFGMKRGTGGVIL